MIRNELNNIGYKSELYFIAIFTNFIVSFSFCNLTLIFVDTLFFQFALRTSRRNEVNI